MSPFASKLLSASIFASFHLAVTYSGGLPIFLMSALMEGSMLGRRIQKSGSLLASVRLRAGTDLPIFLLYRVYVYKRLCALERGAITACKETCEAFLFGLIFFMLYFTRIQNGPRMLRSRQPGRAGIHACLAYCAFIGSPCVHIVTRFRPFCLARYMAWSAESINSASADTRSGSIDTTPTLRVTEIAA